MEFDVHRRRYWVVSVVAIVAVVAAVTVLATGRDSGPRAPSSRSAGGPHSTTTTTTATATNSPKATVPGSGGTTAKFTPDSIPKRGIYEFAGGNSGADAHNPDLAGTTLTFEWARLEPEPGQFEWRAVDQAIAPWAAAGKRVILRVSAGGEATWGAAAADATPAWVYAQGVPAVHDDGSTLPVYWNPTYLADYDAFIAAYAARYDGDPAVSFIEMGIGDGGETLPDTQEGTTDHLAQWAPYGYTDGVWLATIEKIATTFREDFRRTPVVPLVDSTFYGPARSTDYQTLTGWFATNGFPMQYDGLTSTTTPHDSSWGETTTIVEQRGPTSTSGDTLAGDCADATGPMGSKVVLIYQSDIDDPANQEALNACAKSVGS
jgi:hypothetical protein